MTSRTLIAATALLLAACNDNPTGNTTTSVAAPVVKPVEAKVTPASAPKVQSLPKGTIMVPVTADSGGFVVPATINNQIKLNFLIDSGATYVSIPSDVVLTLVRTGTVTDSDFVGTQTFTLADGSTVPSPTFRLRTLKVGNIEVQNVLASVGSVSSPLLLGESFLRRFASWSLDNGRNALLLTGSGAPTILPSTTTPQIAWDVSGSQASDTSNTGGSPSFTEPDAPTWAAVATTDKVSDYVDTSNITSHGDQKFFWVKSVLTMPYQNIKMVVSLRQVSCSGNQTRTLLVSSYDPDGGLVKRTTDYTTRPWGAWKTPQAGSAVQTEVQQVCSVESGE